MKSQSFQHVIKWAFDLITSLLALIVLSPLMALIALAIKLDDSGPVLYVQERVGKNGKIFRCYKFRTMVVGAENKGLGLVGDIVEKRRHIIIYGAGGHAKSVICVVEVQGLWRIAGLLDDDKALAGKTLLGYKILGGRECLETIVHSGVKEGVVAVGDNQNRGLLAQEMLKVGFDLVKVIHPSAVILRGAQIERGTFIHTHAVVGSDSFIGENVIISANVVVGHDSLIGRYAHLAPGVQLGGGVTIGDYSLLGLGAVVLPRVKIGRNVVVGANAVVTCDLLDDVVAVGVPAKMTKRNLDIP